MTTLLTLPAEVLDLVAEHLFQGQDALPGHVLRYRDVNQLTRVSRFLYERLNQKIYERYIKTEGSIATVQMALDAGADIQGRGNEPERDIKSGGTVIYQGDAITQAVANGHEIIARMLIETGNADANPSPTSEQHSPLWWACHSGRINMIKLLLSCPDTDINAVDCKGQSALHGAIKGKQLKSVQAMLEYPQLNPKVTPVVNPVQYAILEGAEEIACALIKDPRSEPNGGLQRVQEQYVRCRAPLLTAMEHGQPDVIRCLLERPDTQRRGADLGWTPIFLAACIQSPSAVQSLLALPETDPHAPDRDGKTPLMVAISEQQPQTARVLAEVKGTNFNHQDKNGNTALILAASLNNGPMVSFFLEREGVDPDIKNHAGYSAQKIASDPSVKSLFPQARASEDTLDESQYIFETTLRS
ncbi:unnamed protein product [Clonostachys rosea]|uniref:F-box domain-containing protein n=1 Tax=Bionectria ochroleuca TaxID=29856 RepID=A0ABY6U4K1_BIOOC|nr:unnamed protein product [Clonostachys rosea]